MSGRSIHFPGDGDAQPHGAAVLIELFRRYRTGRRRLYYVRRACCVLEIISAWKTEKAKLIKREPICCTPWVRTGAEKEEERNAANCTGFWRLLFNSGGCSIVWSGRQGETVSIHIHTYKCVCVYAARLRRVNLTPVGVYPRNPSIITRYISAKEKNVFPRPEYYGSSRAHIYTYYYIYIYGSAKRLRREGVSIKLLFKYSVTYI